MEKAQINISKPLAERMRPRKLEDFIGQEKLVSDKGIISKFIASGSCPSLIFWGNPGVGKTTISYLIAENLGLPYYGLSAVSSGVKEVRDVIEKSSELGKIILFIDEIHRFNKSQQDALLKAVEEGKIILIGATTENPSFEVNKALLSRCKVFVLEDLSVEALKKIVDNALREDEILSNYPMEIIEWEALLKVSGGDARKLLNTIEMISMQNDRSVTKITNEFVEQTVQSNLQLYDKDGEYHYDIISAFIKSIRGSDPNAALYWMVKMLDGGEDPKFIARRLLILASEDIGMANSNALLLANTCFDAVAKIGYPECSIILAHTVVYLATSLKSNASYVALRSAQQYIREHGHQSVPIHLRNAPTNLMKDLNYGSNYKYAHDFEGNFVEMNFLPPEAEQAVFYMPGKNPRENEIWNQLKRWWPKKYQD